MANQVPTATPQAVLSLVAKLGDPDPDFRFMALNDLLQLLQTAKSDLLHHDYNIAARTVDSIIKALDDQNGEVQNLAIKCLGPLVGKISLPILAPMIEKLSSFKLQQAVDSTVPALALRSVIMALPRPVPGLASTPEVQAAYSAISRVLIPRLIGPGRNTKTPKNSNDLLPALKEGLLQNEIELNAEDIDVLIEVVRCFGPLLEQVEVEAMQEVVMGLLQSTKVTSVVKKRAVVAVAMLAIYLNEKNLEEVIGRLTSGLDSSATNAVTRRLYISILGSMARSIPSRFGPYISSAAPRVLRALAEDELSLHLEKMNDGDDVGQDFNEIREAALVTIEAFVASCPAEMRPFIGEVIASCLRYLKYDPNYAVDDDDDDMDDGGSEDNDDDEEFEEDDGFEDDDDDASWKVRRCAAKTLFSLVASRSGEDLLQDGVLYAQAAPALIKRLDEREENVRLEVISSLSALIRKAGDGLHLHDLANADTEPDTTYHAPISRKRRRQSSVGNSTTTTAGLTSPTLEKLPLSGPRADLARLTPNIVKAAKKQLQGKSVSTKQAILALLDDIVSVQRGGLADFLPEIVVSIVEAIKASGSGGGHTSIANSGSGSASATPSTLRVVALGLVSDISRTHSSQVLQPYLSVLVDSVITAIHDKFYKISSEGILTAEELIKTITPPRSRNTGAKHQDDLERLYTAIMDRGLANDTDAEVRQRAIHALGVLLSRTMTDDGAQLLTEARRKQSLDVLRERLLNETTRLASVRAIDSVAAFATTVGQLEKSWIQDVAVELAAQLRKANRSLRGSSVMALKHLTLSPATKGQLAPSNIESIVSALMPAVSSADTQLLGPALLMFANFVTDHPDIVMTPAMISALCELLKGPFASIVLEPLLDFVSCAGKTGSADALMHGLLQEVSVQGDPSVVGRVIGTLLVTNKSSGNVSVQSFVSELQTSSESGDDDRTCLALAVLGEAAMRLAGDASADLRPQTFLDQFHAEPDKVSLSAAIALGRAGSGDVQSYIPVILKLMQEGGNKQYLLIQSIKEILQSLASLTAEIEPHAEQIWMELLQASDHGDNRVVCAECVGRLATLAPKIFIPKLQALLSDKSVAIRGMAVQAVRYTLPENDDAFEAALQGVLVEMILIMLQDPDMEIRRLAMTTLNSATHNKPGLILPRLGDMIPFVLSESVIKPELIREVMMGPFKHTVDDGLEVRKSAYETLYALMETAFSRINSTAFYDRIVAGLKDDNDIRQLCNLMVTKLIVIDPSETARRLDDIAEAYRTVLSVKLKDNAVKQDLEKQEEAQKSVLRVTLQLGDKMKSLTGNAGAATSNAAAAGVWASYWDWVNKEFAKQLKALQDESNQLQTMMV